PASRLACNLTMRPIQPSLGITPRALRARTLCQRFMMASLGGHVVQELAELRGCLELRNRVEFFESGRERVREAPHGARFKVRKRGLEVVVMHVTHEVLRGVELVFHEGLVD